MDYLRTLFFDNPVLDYFNRAAWRRWRRWGWIVALAPLAIAGVHVFFEGLSATRGFPNSSSLPFGLTGLTAILGGVGAAAVAGFVCIFSLTGVRRLLRPDRVEPLFLTALDPAQIWAAAWVALNRNVLILLTATVPLLSVCAGLSRFPSWFILRDVAWLLALANVWFLVFAVGGLQLGLRFPSFFAAAALAGYLIFGEAAAWELGRPSEGDLLPVFLMLHPHALEFPYLLILNPQLVHPMGLPSASVLGWPLAYGPATLGALAFLAIGLIGRLLIGPMRLPLAPDAGAAGAKRRSRLQDGFLKWTENPFPWLAVSRPTYTWTQIWERLYENAHPRLRRHSYLVKNVASGILWIVLVVAFFDFLAMAFSRDPLVFHSPTLVVFVLSFLVLGLVAGFHFAYAGADEQGMAHGPRLPARVGAYASKIAVLAVGTWIAGASGNRGSKWEWPLNSQVMISTGFAALALGAQIAFQLWASSNSRHAVQSVFLGAAHALAIGLGPFLFLLVSPLAPRWVTKLVSLSPPLALVELAYGVEWRIERHVPGGGVDNYLLEPDVRWPAALLAAEIAVFGALWAMSRRTRRLGNAE